MPRVSPKKPSDGPAPANPTALARLEERFWLALRSRLRRERHPHEWYVCWLLTVTALLEGTLEPTRLNQRLLRRHLRRQRDAGIPSPSSRSRRENADRVGG